MATALKTLPDAPHAQPAGEVLARLGVSASKGLADEEIRRRLKLFGSNTVVSTSKASGLIILLHQFQSPVVYLLSAAAALAFYFGELEEGVAIAAVLGLNGLIGFLTEWKAARSIEALRALGSHSARVRRDGHTRTIPAEQIVPGDIVVLEAGDAVSADMRLVEASNVAVDESTLTGESVAVHKHLRPVAADARLADRSSMLFKGTALTRGSGIGVVTATGLATELGRVSQLVEEAEPGSSPLEKKLARLSAQLVWAVLDPNGGDRRRRPHHCQGPVPDDRGGNCPRSRGDSGRSAGRGDASAGTRHVAHGAAERADRATLRGGDARRHHRHPH